MRNRRLTSRFHEDRMFHLYWTYILRPIRIVQAKLSEWWSGNRYSNREDIQREVDENRGRIVLFGFEMERLIGWTEQYDSDYYYVTVGRDRTLHRNSCVMGFIPLLGNLRSFDYFSLAHVWNLNYPTFEQGLRMAEQAKIWIK